MINHNSGNGKLFMKKKTVKFLFHPLRMEAAFFVHTLVGMGAEVVPLCLQHIGIAAGGTVGIKVGQGTA